MPYIIDGNNLMGSTPEIGVNEPNNRDQIIALIRKFQENKNVKIVLVFDGDPGSGNHKQQVSPKFSIYFPSYGHNADDEIKRILNGYVQYQDVIVVTSDRELKRFSKELGAKTRNSIEFYFELKRVYYQQGKKEENQRRIEESLSKKEVDQWLKIFKINQ